MKRFKVFELKSSDLCKITGCISSCGCETYTHDGYTQETSDDKDKNTEKATNLCESFRDSSMY